MERICAFQGRPSAHLPSIWGAMEEFEGRTVDFVLGGLVGVS